MWRTIQGGSRWLQSTVSTTKMKHIYWRQRKVVWMKKSQSKLLKGNSFVSLQSTLQEKINIKKNHPAKQRCDTAMIVKWKKDRIKKNTDHSCSQIVKYQHFVSHPSAARTEGCDKALIFDDLEMRKGCKKESQITVDLSLQNMKKKQFIYSIQPFVAPEGASQSVINCFKWCHLNQCQFVLKIWNYKKNGGINLGNMLILDLVNGKWTSII